MKDTVEVKKSDLVVLCMFVVSDLCDNEIFSDDDLAYLQSNHKKLTELAHKSELHLFESLKPYLDKAMED